jgi:hemolysin activation/secretion protein
MGVRSGKTNATLYQCIRSGVEPRHVSIKVFAIECHSKMSGTHFARSKIIKGDASCMMLRKTWAACVLAALATASLDGPAFALMLDHDAPMSILAGSSAESLPGSDAQVAATASPKFEIRGFIPEGNTLLTQKVLDRAFAPFIGKDKDFGDVQRAVEALRAAYRAAGYGAVEIRLPEQELERGKVRLTVIEAKIRNIDVEGNRYFSKDNVRRGVPSLKEGSAPNSSEIARSVRLANENPAKQQTVLLRRSNLEHEIDATIRVADVNPERVSVSLDNSGNRSTGRLRLGLAYQHANMIDRDHVFSAQYITSPENFHDVSVSGVGYKLPLYAKGDSVDFLAGYSAVDSGTVQDLFVVSGKGAIFAARYNQGLTKWGDLEHRLSYGLEYRAYQNSVVPVGGVLTLVPDITVHPFTLAYSAGLRQGQYQLSFILGISQNLPGGSDGSDQDFKNARFMVGNARYRVFRIGGAYNRSLGADWQLRVRLDGQYTDDALVTGEQFAIGGADNVRGFNERYLSNDKGIRTNWEIYTPEFARQLGFEKNRLRFLAFYDTGTAKRNQPLPGELESGSLDSGGIGMRLSYKESYTVRVDFGHVFHDGSLTLEPAGRRNINKVHVSFAAVW